MNHFGVTLCTCPCSILETFSLEMFHFTLNDVFDGQTISMAYFISQVSQVLYFLNSISSQTSRDVLNYFLNRWSI